IRHWPRMTHDQLVRVFPDGKTVHVPSDGVPLKNYQLALAEVERRGSAPSAMSLAAARNAGVRVADADVSPGRGRNFLAKLLGIGKDEQEESDATAPRAGQPGAATAATARQQVAAAVPMPRARPGGAGGAAVAAGAGEFSLASASSSPL